MIKRGSLELTIQETQRLQLEILATFVDVCEKNNISYFVCGGNALGAVRHGGPIPWDYDTDLMVPEDQIDALCKYLRVELEPKFYVDYHHLGAYSRRPFPRIALTGYDSGMFHVSIFRLIGFPSEPKEQSKLFKKAKILREVLDIKLRFAKARTPFRTMVVRFLKLALFCAPTKLLFASYDKLCAKYPYEKAAYAGYLAGQRGIVFKRELFGEYTIVDYAGIPIRIFKEYDFYFRWLYGDYMELPPQEEREKAMNKTYILYESKRRRRR